MPGIGGPSFGTVTIEVPWHRAAPTSGHFCYRLYDGDTLVYVGVSGRLRHRLRAHARDKRFTSWSAEEFPHRLAAEQRERVLIETLSPLLNVAIGTGRFGS